MKEPQAITGLSINYSQYWSQDQFNPMVEFPNNEFGISFIGTDSRPYSVFIKDGQIIPGSQSGIIYNHETYATRSCKFGTDSMIVISIINTGGHTRQVHGRVVDKSGQVSPTHSFQIPNHNTQIDLHSCLQISSDLILIGASDWDRDGASSHWGSAVFTYVPSTNTLGSRQRTSANTSNYQWNAQFIQLKDSNSSKGLVLFQEYASTSLRGFYIEQFNPSNGILQDQYTRLTSSIDVIVHERSAQFVAINGGGFAFVYKGTGDSIVVEKYDNTFSKECFSTVSATDGKHPRLVYDDVTEIVYIVYVNQAGTKLMGASVDFSDSNCTIEVQPQLIYESTNVMIQPVIQIARSDSKTSYLAITFQAEGNRIFYTEYFLRSNSDCTFNNKCYGCKDGSDVCPVCRGTVYEDRVTRRKPDDSCLCQDGHYHKAGMFDCDICDLKCATCETSSDNCLTCSHLISRDDANNCECRIGWFEKGEIECGKCQYQCQTCQVSDTQCIDCSDVNREGAACTCKQGYLDLGVATCGQCNSACKSCITDLDTCSLCHDDNATRDPSTQCLCKTGFYEFNPVQISCSSQCHEKCSTCSGSYDNCSSCGPLRKPGTEPACPCLDTHLPSGDTCIECAQKCGSCETTIDTCTTCSDNISRDDSQNCICRPSYYEKGTSDCGQCEYQCANCENSASQCTECSDSNREGSSCTCKVGYLDKGIPTCEKCNGACKACTGDKDTCSQCHDDNATREPSSQCACKSGFYEFNPIQVQCSSVCHSKCDSCGGSFDNCTSCGANRVPGSHPSCPCSDGYYDNAGICEVCDHSQCATCSISSTDCVIFCEEGCNRCNSDNECLDVEEGYFKNPSGNVQKCDRECVTCQNSATECLIFCDQSCGLCNGTGDCITCALEFYQDGLTCKNCPIKCHLCESEDVCISCKSGGVGRTSDIETNCGCLDGYYDDGINLDCQRCKLTNCQKCDNNGDCLECSNKGLQIPLCENPKSGFIEFVDSEREELQQCSPKCLTCENSEDNCTQCSLGEYRLGIEDSCECMAGYHDNNGDSQDCQKCEQNCELCKEMCLKCKDIENLDLNSYSGKCECKEGYKLDFKRNCQRCFEYQGKCLSACPTSSLENRNKYSCEQKDFLVKDNQVLIWVCCSVVLLSLALIYLAARKSSQQKLREIPKKTSLDRQIENN